MQNCVRNHAVIHHDHNTAGDADNQCHTKEIPRAVNKGTGEGFFAHAGNDTHDDRSCQKDSRDFRHPPTQYRYAVNHKGKGCSKKYQDRFARGGKFQHRF